MGSDYSQRDPISLHNGQRMKISPSAPSLRLTGESLQYCREGPRTLREDKKRPGRRNTCGLYYSTAAHTTTYADFCQKRTNLSSTAASKPSDTEDTSLLTVRPRPEPSPFSLDLDGERCRKLLVALLHPSSATLDESAHLAASSTWRASLLWWYDGGSGAIIVRRAPYAPVFQKVRGTHIFYSTQCPEERERIGGRSPNFSDHNPILVWLTCNSCIADYSSSLKWTLRWPSGR